MKEAKQEPKYTKEQLLESAKFGDRPDLVNALLHDGELYTVEEAEKVINKFMKGKVKTC